MLSAAPVISRRSTMKAFSAVRRMRSSAAGAGTLSGVAASVRAGAPPSGVASSSVSWPRGRASVTWSQSMAARRASPTESPTR